MGPRVTQILGGIVFRSTLGHELAHHAGLDASQIALLSAAGTAYVRKTTEKSFPRPLQVVLQSYYTAIPSIFASGVFLRKLGKNVTNQIDTGSLLRLLQQPWHSSLLSALNGVRSRKKDG